jgi:hypothetical protein
MNTDKHRCLTRIALISTNSKGLKARKIIAQGIALGKTPTKFPSPERAAEKFL